MREEDFLLAIGAVILFFGFLHVMAVRALMDIKGAIQRLR